MLVLLLVMLLLLKMMPARVLLRRWVRLLRRFLLLAVVVVVASRAPSPRAPDGACLPPQSLRRSVGQGEILPRPALPFSAPPPRPVDIIDGERVA